MGKFHCHRCLSKGMKHGKILKKTWEMSSGKIKTMVKMHGKFAEDPRKTHGLTRVRALPGSKALP